MDSRTRERYQKKASLLMHLIAGHYGALGPEADYAAIYREGMDAISALALPVVVRQQMRLQRKASDVVRVALEVYAGTEDDEPVSVPSCWPMEQEPWGIGRGLPTGDVQ